MKYELTVVDFKEGHMDLMPRMRYTAVEKDELVNRLMRLKSTAVIKTIIFHDMAIGIVGISPLNNGVAEVFSILTDNIKFIPILFHKTMKTLLQSYIDLMKLHRVQCTVREGYESGIKWANSLGFTAECLMKKYGPDKQNYWLFARVQ